MFAALVIAVALSSGDGTEHIKSLTAIVAASSGSEAKKAEDVLLSMGPQALPSILIAANGYKEPERARVVHLLSHFGPDAYQPISEIALKDSRAFGNTHPIWQLGIDGVAAIGEAATQRATAALSKGEAHGDEFWFAKSVLGAQGNEAVPALLLLAKSPNSDVRLAAIDLLGVTKDSKARATLLAATDDPSSAVRRRSLEALAAMGMHDAVPIAEKAVLRDNFFLVRSMALLVLSRLDGTNTHLVRITFAARSDPSILVRVTATELLRDTKSGIGLGLGQRYNPIFAGPAEQEFLEGRRMLFLSVSLAVAAALCALGTVLTMKSVSLFDRTSLIGAFGSFLLGLGWAWGYLVNGITWQTEYEFLVLTLGCVGGLGVFAATTIAKERKRSCLKTWLGLLSCVHIGYFVGWMQLWGWSFEWLGLFRLWGQSLAG